MLLPQDLLGALATLEPLELSPETRTHWAQLAEAALDQEALAVAERCYAAMGDVAKARYLHKVCRAQGTSLSATHNNLPLSCCERKQAVRCSAAYCANLSARLILCAFMSYSWSRPPTKLAHRSSSSCRCL